MERPRQNTYGKGLDAGPGDPGRYTVRAAGGSERPRQNTSGEGLDARPGDPGRYTVRAAGSSGAAAKGDARTVLALVDERADASPDRLGFRGLHKDLQQEILQHVSTEVTLREQLFRKRPDDMAESMAKYPFLLAHMAAHPLLFSVNQEYVISRALQTLFRWGRLLTIKLSESVDRTRLNSAISAIDAARLCDRVDYTETWSGVSIIRLREERRLNDFGEEVGYPFFVFELVRRGHDGVDNIVAPSRRFALKGRIQKKLLRYRLVKELGLKHKVVDGVAEFWC
jgi:hypothetical protein